MVSNPAPCLPALTGRVPECKACWVEPPTTVEMALVERLLKEITELSAQKLTGAAVALLLQAADTADSGEGPPGLSVLGS